MATETACRPRGVTDLATYRPVIVRESRSNVASMRREQRPTFCRPAAVSWRRRISDCSATRGGSIVSMVCGISQRMSGDIVDCCQSFVPSQTESRTPWRVAGDSANRSWPAVAARDQRRTLVDGSVTIDACRWSWRCAARRRAFRFRARRRRSGNRRTASRLRGARLSSARPWKISPDRHVSILLSSRSSRLPLRSCLNMARNTQP